MINDLGELKKLLQLCRKQGVTEIKFDNVELKLGEMPQEQVVIEENDQNEKIDELVGIQAGFEGIDPMAFYSADSRIDSQ